MIDTEDYKTKYEELRSLVKLYFSIYNDDGQVYPDDTIWEEALESTMQELLDTIK